MTSETFRAEVKAWLAEHCPPLARGKGEAITIGSKRPMSDASLLTWRRDLGKKGWIVPSWPKAYGGGGLSDEEISILYDELDAIEARIPIGGMGVSMIGPTLLEYGTEEQKMRHLPNIAMGDISWCQGYSEPGAGSDLASLRTKAVDKGNHFEVTGQKIWTSGAQFADWAFVLVRTDFDVPKHEGISFVLMDMNQSGVKIKPIQLISGSSPFCETFFDEAIAHKDDLVGQLNRGWSVGKRLLQHERSGQGGLGQKRGRPVQWRPDVVKTALSYIGVDNTDKIADHGAREKVLKFMMNSRSFKLTQERVGQENASGKTLGETTSIFKVYGATLSRDGADLHCELMGNQGYGWQENGFSPYELESTRQFLATRAHTIYGGTNEIQLNIISKRVLGLPE